ncbi:hypothetical protein Tco_0851351 [Tanacetum coccineum]
MHQTKEEFIVVLEKISQFVPGAQACVNLICYPQLALEHLDVGNVVQGYRVSLLVNGVMGKFVSESLELPLMCATLFILLWSQEEWVGLRWLMGAIGDDIWVVNAKLGALAIFATKEIEVLKELKDTQ